MKKTVLVIDDSRYMRTLITEVLIEAGYDVVGEAETGEDAIEKVLEHAPDLITLDTVLPDMLGMDVLEILKEEEVDTKVVMVSAVGQEDVVQEGLDSGASAYIVKPFQNNFLLDKVKEALV